MPRSSGRATGRKAVGSGRRATSTSAFGVSRRESHDSSGFYARFAAPVLSDDDSVNPSPIEGKIVCGDARRMDEVDDSSVALVVTSPPYFAGKEYESALGEGHVPASYLDYLDMLRDVFAECVRKLEPGGRVAVNVANLGRKPYRSLSADVIGILQDDLGLLLRGEIIWLKARGATGSCAWGSFRSPANPVTRDLTERIIVASKGRFDRALAPDRRRKAGLPSKSSLTADEFMDATTDVWEIPSESARRVGHPAPFPVELPLRLIGLHTYLGDLVLDPFLGSGSTAVAAVRGGRRFVGYDTESDYVLMAQRRVDAEIQARAGAYDSSAPFDGRRAHQVAREMLENAGFSEIQEDVKVANGVSVTFSAHDAKGRRWLFDLAGGFTTLRSGLSRTDVLWRALGRAALVHASDPSPLVLLTTQEPARGTSADLAWRSLGPKRGARKSSSIVFDVVQIDDPDARGRLGAYASARS